MSTACRPCRSRDQLGNESHFIHGMVPANHAKPKAMPLPTCSGLISLSFPHNLSTLDLFVSGNKRGVLWLSVSREGSRTATLKRSFGARRCSQTSYNEARPEDRHAEACKQVIVRLGGFPPPDDYHRDVQPAFDFVRFFRHERDSNATGMRKLGNRQALLSTMCCTSTTIPSKMMGR